MQNPYTQFFCLRNVLDYNHSTQFRNNEWRSSWTKTFKWFLFSDGHSKCKRIVYNWLCQMTLFETSTKPFSCYFSLNGVLFVNGTNGFGRIRCFRSFAGLKQNGLSEVLVALATSFSFAKSANLQIRIVREV